ncbi:tRNA-(ms[2]io[6]A)-hydroxylase [Dasania marina]|uniref:tRNA-(ms[2]io[6]A)-hydroxylase n=1 Tax=Dasania marina TaxID=471499 RepID=UPI00036CA973|nr:tRNA-(ms[2]io[6]A)-hydroxylase [Dasania marina]
MSKVNLAYQTPAEWTATVLADFDRFLLDHATAEKKASGMAMSMLSHYPDKIELVHAMADLAIEEMTHFREVIKLVHERGGQADKDGKDPYVNEFRTAFRRGKEEYFLDRMLVGAIIEARGAERFGLIADALQPGKLKTFYVAISRSEQRHEGLFVDLAYLYFDKAEVDIRLAELIAIEAEIVKALPHRAALH